MSLFILCSCYVRNRFACVVCLTNIMLLAQQHHRLEHHHRNTCETHTPDDTHTKLKTNHQLQVMQLQRALHAPSSNDGTNVAGSSSSSSTERAKKVSAMCTTHHTQHHNHHPSKTTPQTPPNVFLCSSTLLVLCVSVFVCLVLVLVRFGDEENIYDTVGRIFFE